MARQQSEYYPQDAIYRAQVVWSDSDGTYLWSATYGPYASAPTAKGVATQKSKHRYPRANVEITIQKAVTVWEDVE